MSGAAPSERAIAYILAKAECEVPSLRAELYDLVAELSADDVAAATLTQAANAIREAEAAQMRLKLHFQRHATLTR